MQNALLPLYVYEQCAFLKPFTICYTAALQKIFDVILMSFLMTYHNNANMGMDGIAQSVKQCTSDAKIASSNFTSVLSLVVCY